MQVRVGKQRRSELKHECEASGTLGKDPCARAREHGLERLRRWVSFLVLCGVLERARLGNRAVLKDFSRAEIFD